MFFIVFGAGYVKVTDEIYYNYVFNYTDHLGNIRMSWTWYQKSGSVAVMEENHYYPFGLKHRAYNVESYTYAMPMDGSPGYNIPELVDETVDNPNPYKYKYNGKELQDELGLNMYDYGGRNYDPASGRFINMDLLAEISRRFSPYTYAMNNPVYFIDVDGMYADANGVERDDRPTYGGGHWSDSVRGVNKDVENNESTGSNSSNANSKKNFNLVNSDNDNQNYKSVDNQEVPKTGKANIYIETDGVGHVFVEVGGVVYSYGRYNGSYSPASGPLGPLGDGVLLRLEGKDATNFISERAAKYPTEVFSVDVNVSSVKSYYDKLYNSGTPIENKKGFNKFGRAIDTYNLVGPGGNNCTTLTYKALNSGGANIGASQTPAGMKYDFARARYMSKGFNPGLFGPKR